MGWDGVGHICHEKPATHPISRFRLTGLAFDGNTSCWNLYWLVIIAWRKARSRSCLPVASARALEALCRLPQPAGEDKVLLAGGLCPRPGGALQAATASRRGQGPLQ